MYFFTFVFSFPFPLAQIAGPLIKCFLDCLLMSHRSLRCCSFPFLFPTFFLFSLSLSPSTVFSPFLLSIPLLPSLHQMEIMLCAKYGPLKVVKERRSINCKSQFNHYNQKLTCNTYYVQTYLKYQMESKIPNKLLVILFLFWSKVYACLE